MRRIEFQELIDSTFDRMRALTATKGEEYKGVGDNQLANFERLALDLHLTREQVLLVYLSKHLDSIKTAIADFATGKSREYSEPLAGRVDDAILYLLLLKGMFATRPNGVSEYVAVGTMDGIEHRVPLKSPDGVFLGPRGGRAPYEGDA